MTREQKLALLIGFTLVLVVGVVISDHLSGASRAQLEGGVAGVGEEADPMSRALTSALPANEPEPPARRFIAPSEERVPRIGFEEGPTPTDTRRTLAEASPETQPRADSPISSLAALFEKQKGALGNGIADLADTLQRAPAAAQTDRQPQRQTAIREPRAERAAQTPAPRRYVVKEGDTLWKIAQRHYGDGSLHEALANANEGRVGTNGMVYVGATILLPDKDALLGGAPVTDASASARVGRAAGTPTERSPSTRRYTVKKGDTLGEIASALLGSARRWPEIVRANEDVIDDPDNVPAGVVLKIPAR